MTFPEIPPPDTGSLQDNLAQAVKALTSNDTVFTTFQIRDVSVTQISFVAFKTPFGTSVMSSVMSEIAKTEGQMDLNVI